MVIVTSERDRVGFAANLEMQRGLGIDVRPISADELAAIDPNAHLAEGEIAAFEAEAGYADAVQTVTSFADAACVAGADIRLGVEVRAIRTQGSRIIGAETSEGSYSCGQVVLATGSWAAQLCRGLGIDMPVQACRTQVALSRRPPDTRPGPVYGDFVQGLYFKPAAGELVHAGSLAGEETANPVDPDHYDEAAAGPWLAEVRKRLARRCPILQRAPGRGGYGALYEVTPDWHPVIDRLAGVEGAYCAVGFSGHGFKMSPIVGQLVAELLVDGQATTLDLTPLRLARFAERDLVTTPYPYGVMG